MILFFVYIKIISSSLNLEGFFDSKEFWRIRILTIIVCVDRFIQRKGTLAKISQGFLCTIFWRKISIYSNLLLQFLLFSCGVKHSLKQIRVVYKSCRIQEYTLPPFPYKAHKFFLFIPKYSSIFSWLTHPANNRSHLLTLRPI